MKGGENRSTQRPLSFCSKESRWRAPAAAGDLAVQVGASAAPLAMGTSALHALEASYTFQAQAPTEPCTLDVPVLGIFKVCPLPGSHWAHIENDQTNSAVQQQAS